MVKKSFRDRDRKPARPQQPVPSKSRVLVVCEGEVTEKEYIEGCAAFFRNGLVDVVLEEGAGTPKSVVTRAKDLREKAIEKSQREDDENLIFESVWAVFDRDDHPCYEAALIMAKDNNILAASSNPSFELWLLIHFLKHSPGMMDRREARAKLKAFLPDYDKHVGFQDYEEGYGIAVRIAQRMVELAEQTNNRRGNPTTHVHELTETIRRASSH